MATDSGNGPWTPWAGRAPVASGPRPPGVGATPPTAWPAPKLAEPPAPPDGPDRRRRSPALVGFVAFLVGSLVMGAAFATYALGDRRDGAPTRGATRTSSQRVDTVTSLEIRKILDIAQPSVFSITTGSANSIFGGALGV